MVQLRSRFSEWQEWAATADRTEDGWQSDFPGWDLLIAAAKGAMLHGVDDATLDIVAECWEASQEGEELLEWARDHIEECWSALERLSCSALSGCRWQVYEAASAAGKKAEPLLRRGLTDPDPYARRRAILALARLRPSGAEELADMLRADADPYIRQASVEMILAAPNEDFRQRALAELARDPVDHVRRAAREGLAASSA
jgi:HEAT repeat protein